MNSFFEGKPTEPVFVVDGALPSIVVAAIHIVYFVAAAVNAVVAAKRAKSAAASAVPPS